MGRTLRGHAGARQDVWWIDRCRGELVDKLYGWIELPSLAKLAQVGGPGRRQRVLCVHCDESVGVCRDMVVV